MESRELREDREGGEERTARGPWWSQGASEKVSLSASGIPLHWQCKDGNQRRRARGVNDPFFLPWATGVFWKKLPWQLPWPGICNAIALCQTAISKDGRNYACVCKCCMKATVQLCIVHIGDAALALKATQRCVYFRCVFLFNGVQVGVLSYSFKGPWISLWTRTHGANRHAQRETHSSLPLSTTHTGASS